MKIEETFNEDTEIRRFFDYISRNEFILPHVFNFDSFRKEVWKSYFVKNRDMFDDMISEFRRIQRRKIEIEKRAVSQRSDWKDIIDIFNNRFFVPFELIVTNQVGVSLGQESVPVLGYRFKEYENGNEVTIDVSKSNLTDVLSTGEIRAFYILNVMFEINVRRRNAEETIIIFDDIADSFDYRNKYAIIQYLEEISSYDNFKQIILTHNYDFFRSVIRTGTIASEKDMRLMIEKNDDRLIIMNAKWKNNVFVDDWKTNFAKSTRKRIASIPFMRNLIEYTKGTQDRMYSSLTSLLHIKSDTSKIMDEWLYMAYGEIFGEQPLGPDPRPLSVLQLIIDEANMCIGETNINPSLESKIVLSIATRLVAEKYISVRIEDRNIVDSINENQTRQLYSEFIRKFDEKDVISILNRVVLMTPENIHLNSFMYEPIVDMSDEHLRSIFKDVKSLLKSVSSDLDWDVDMKF